MTAGPLPNLQASPCESSPSSGPLVLVVADEKAQRDVLTSVLSSACRVDAAASVGEAVLKAELTPPALVIMDFPMPAASGIGGLQRLREIFPLLPVLVLAGHADFEAARETIQLDAIEYLRKPFGPPDLLSVVLRLTMSAADRAEVPRAPFAGIPDALDRRLDAHVDPWRSRLAAIPSENRLVSVLESDRPVEAKVLRIGRDTAQAKHGGKKVTGEFLPVMFGADTNGYSMARSFFEEYRKKPIVVGSSRTPPANWSNRSNILEMRAVSRVSEQDVFLETAIGIARELHLRNVTPIIVGCHDKYVRLIAENKPALQKHFVVPHIDEHLLNQLLVKANLYQLCAEKNIDHPRTTVLDPGADPEDVNLAFPLVIKPSDTVEYSLLDFPGKKKVFIVRNAPSFTEAVAKIRTAGYKAQLIVQEFIPAAETDNYTFAAYLDRNSKVKMAVFLRHAVQECVPAAYGMPTALVVDNQHIADAVLEKYVKLLEGVNYVGHANFDIIYDSRDQKYKLLEINIRQGRSVYSLTAAGVNAMKLIVDDYIFKQEMDFKWIEKRIVWSLLPARLLLKSILEPAMKSKIKELIAGGEFHHPLDCRLERSLVRRIQVKLSKLNHYVKHYRHYRAVLEDNKAG